MQVDARHEKMDPMIASMVGLCAPRSRLCRNGPQDAFESGCNVEEQEAETRAGNEMGKNQSGNNHKC